jgi:phenylalanyl-tRNA synthetase alpha chain
LRAEIAAAIDSASDLATLETIRVSALGKKGRLTELMKQLGSLSPDARREAGQALNQVKDALSAALDGRKGALEAAALDARLVRERLDMTLPVRPENTGRIHPISQVIEELTAIFSEMGFSVAEGPEIETGWHNFTALNMPPHHPARQMHDTFFLPNRPGDDADHAETVLRTHTSPVQIRSLLKGALPLRVIAPGRTYRSDYDMTHTPMFHQVEGLVVGEDITLAHLKGCITEFCRRFFEIDDLPVRFRPSFFPFTEPSMEVDIGCSRKSGELVIGAGDDWLEILGSGMVHHNVLRAGGVDPDKYQGFAFGMGIERIAMLKYGIPDLRTFFDADIRWLRHYGFAATDVPSLAQGLTK